MFISVTTAIYFALPWRIARNIVLLVASIIFYSWGEPRLVLIMMLVAFVAYIGGLIIAQGKKSKLPIYIITLILITSNLVVFKYLNFFVDNINNIFGANIEIASIALPIGISFYTFQILSYVIDLYRGEVKVQKNYFYLLLYLCFFPQLIAGPIVRYSTVEEEILKRKENTDDIAYGTKRFIIGLSKKVILANGLAQLSEMIYAGSPEVYGSIMYWIAAIAYTLQIYYDFSGYSDMAIGLGRIYGFHFLENFNYPYNSRSITEFWHNWHISLSTWFRDYIYIPIGGNRVSKPRWLLNLLIVWALTGLWHGASWNFVIWGLYYCVILIIEKLFLGKLLDKIPGIFGWIYTMFIVICGWVVFNLTDMNAMISAFTQMFSAVPTNFLKVYASGADIVQYALYLIPGIIFMFPITKKIIIKEDSALLNAVIWIIYIALLILSLIYLFSNSYNPFIYFRF